MEAANNKFNELIKKKFRGLNKISDAKSAKGLKAKLVQIFDPQIWLEEMGYSPSDDGVARHGDIVMGFDRHALQLFIPPLPPIPLSVYPIPFLGLLNVKKPEKPVYVQGRRVATEGIRVYCKVIRHGKAMPLSDFFPILQALDGSMRPRVELYNPSSHSKKVFVNNKRILKAGEQRINLGCKPVKYYVIKGSGSVTTR
jgi:hypothetical protein